MYTYMFQYNIPHDNHVTGNADDFLNVIAQWNDKDFYHDGSPMVFVELVNPSLYTCVKVKDWFIVERQIKQIARNHFADFAKQQRINRAKAELAEAGELVENPVIQRYEPNSSKINPVMAEIITNHFTAAV